MHEQVKKYADEGNIKGLKYIFVDALDVDPTFEKYREDFHYCKGLNLFEPNRELSPKKQNSSDWNMEYWKALKLDLLENLSEERLQHMREVATVIYADKIARKKETQSAPKEIKPEPAVKVPSAPTNVDATAKTSANEKQEREPEVKKRIVESESIQQTQTINKTHRVVTGMRTVPKKADGTLPIAAIAGVAIAALILLMFLRK